MLTSALLAATLSSPAHACGGFFCNAAQPVVQNAERIVFDIDEADGFVDTHVQIFYEGPADEFAWIVPVPGEPELFASSQALFDLLPFATGPIFSMNQVIEGRCGGGGNRGFNLFGSADFSMAGAPSADSRGTSTITVVSQGEVGPYDTIVLKAESEDGLLDFLQANGYDLTDDLSDVLAPYISKDAHFVALKLQKDKEVGDITPLGMRYAGDRAMIPIQLTSVAATPDMRLEVYVFGEERAVPKSYLHVQINHAAVDWWTFGSNYSDVITQAANEAGGHAFATDFAGSPEFLRNSLYGGWIDLDPLRRHQDAREWIQGLVGFFGVTPEVMNVVADHVQVPDGADLEDFVACSGCYGGWDPLAFDAEVATDDAHERLLRPLEDAEEMFTRRYLTRMTSSLDAIEMTVDPVFVLNPDMSKPRFDVPQQRTSNLVYECGAGKPMDKAKRRLVLEDGREIDLPSEQWFADNGTTEFEFIEDLGLTKAQIIEATDERGTPTVLFDYTDELFDLTDAHNDMVRDLLGLGCGCAVAVGTGNVAGTGLLLGLVGLGLRRRRLGFA